MNTTAYVVPFDKIIWPQKKVYFVYSFYIPLHAATHFTDLGTYEAWAKLSVLGVEPWIWSTAI